MATLLNAAAGPARQYTETLAIRRVDLRDEHTVGLQDLGEALYQPMGRQFSGSFRDERSHLLQGPVPFNR